jgi:hypothetical protein
MAGAVRQPIDVQSLERYISKNVPGIQVPIDVKQVGFIRYPPPPINSDFPNSLVLDSRTRHIN